MQRLPRRNWQKDWVLRNPHYPNGKNGMNNPKSDDLIRISDQLGISLKELIDEESSENNEAAVLQQLSLAGTESESKQ